MESNPRFIYLLFGRQAMLGSTLLWMKILSPKMFIKAVDASIFYLFHWSAKEVSMVSALACSMPVPEV